MIRLKSIILAMLTIYLFHCGGEDPVEEGIKAFQNSDYGTAIKLLVQARKMISDFGKYDEKLALAYMYRGEELFSKTNNIKSFSGNYEKALKYIPSHPSADFRQNYSKILYSLGEAYLNAKPQNELQLDQFLDQAIMYLEDAMMQDSTNVEALALLTKVKQDNYNKWLTKGRDYYAKAQKRKDVDLYFLAEYYVKKAADFKQDDQEIKSLHSKIKEKTLAVLNYRDDIALAVADQHSHEGKLFLDITVKNYLVTPLSLEVSKFQLVDKAGNSYKMDKSLMTNTFAERSIKNTQLDENKAYVDGLLIFNVPPNTKVDYLAYQIDDKKVTKKYFP